MNSLHPVITYQSNIQMFNDDSLVIIGGFHSCFYQPQHISVGPNSANRAIGLVGPRIYTTRCPSGPKGHFEFVFNEAVEW